MVSDEGKCNGEDLKLLKIETVKYHVGKMQSWFLLLPFLKDHIINTRHILSIFLTVCLCLRQSEMRVNLLDKKCVILDLQGPK